MLQHPGQALPLKPVPHTAPCLSPPGSLVFEDFANLKSGQGRAGGSAIQNKHLRHRMSSALDSAAQRSPREMSAAPRWVLLAAAVCVYLLHSLAVPGML